MKAFSLTVLLLMQSACAIGYISECTVVGIALGQAKLESPCSAPVQGRNAAPTVAALEGGQLSPELSQLFAAISSAFARLAAVLPGGS